MPFKCNPGKNVPCTSIQEYESPKGPVRNHKLTNGWKYYGEYFINEKEHIKTKKFNESIMCEPEEQSDDEVPTYDEEEDIPGPLYEPSYDDEDEAKLDPAPPPARAPAPAPCPCPCPAPVPAPAPPPPPARAPAPDPVPAPPPPPPPAPDPATSDNCYDYEEKIFYAIRENEDGDYLFCKMTTNGDKLVAESGTLAINLQQDWFMDYVKDLIPEKGIFVVLDSRNVFAFSDENGNPIRFPKNYKKGIFIKYKEDAQNYIPPKYYNASKDPIDFIDFIISFLKKHIIVFYESFIFHLNFGQRLYSKGYAYRRHVKQDEHLHNIHYNEEFATVTPFVQTYIHDFYNFMNHNLLEAFEGKTDTYKYDALLRHVKLLKEWYPTLKITATQDRQSYILDKNDDEKNIQRRKNGWFTLFYDFEENEFLKKSMALDADMVTQLQKLEKLFEYVRCRRKYFMIESGKSPIELVFGIDLNDKNAENPFELFKVHYAGLFGKVILEKTDTTKNFEGFIQNVPETVHVLKNKYTSPPTSSLPLIEKLVKDYLKKHPAAKVGGKSRNRRLKSRRMLKKSGYKKTRKYNRKIIK